ncbi:hypothetical protein NL676_034101 [Syzygium grande]|nr:hypothetical protein NL676_034101 [Syzygium grande]
MSFEALKRGAPPPRTSRTAVDEDKGRAKADVERSEERREGLVESWVWGVGERVQWRSSRARGNLGRNSENPVPAAHVKKTVILPVTDIRIEGFG